MKDIKIGILTFHEADNYGAILQAYALNKVLSGSEIINYHNRYIFEQTQKLPKGNVVKKIVAYIFKKIKHYNFLKFIKTYLDLSDIYTSKNMNLVNEKFSKVVVGSDQVWNMECTNNDIFYFLPTVDKKKKYSYAASFGSASFPAKECAEYLSEFQIVSLREKKYFENVHSINKNVRFDLDPTLLLSADQWGSIATKRILKDKYVFVYTVGEPIELLHNAKDYAKKNGCKLITNKRSLEFLLNCSPEDFISWVMFADCVFTNSFHGTVFSTIFHKKFYVECKQVNGFNNRAEFLLKLLGLETRLIYAELDDTDVNWENVDNNLAQERNKSMIYLETIMQEKPDETI